MKKLVLILGLFLGLSANAQADDNINKQEFVNPIFYKQLHSYSKGIGNIYLSPNQIEFRTPLDENLIDERMDCTMLENTYSYLKFKCLSNSVQNVKQEKFYKISLVPEKDAVNRKFVKIEYLDKLNYIHGYDYLYIEK